MPSAAAVAFAALALAASAVASTQHATVTPIQKVLQMMGDMKSKALKEKQNEIVMMTKFEAWCKNTDKSKKTAIKEGTDQAEQLAADIEKYNSDAKILGEDIAKLDEALNLAEQDKASATEIRKKEKADYDAAHAEYVENIDDLAGALQKIKQMMSNAPGASAASLLQELAAKPAMPVFAKQFLTAFIAEGSSEDLAVAEGAEMQAPEAAAFESQSGGIVSMMEELDKKLVDEKTQLEKEEASKRHSYDMMMGSLANAITQHKTTRSNKLKAKKEAETSSAQAKGDLSDTKSTLAEDTKYLSDLQVMCETKMSDFATAQKVRGDELEALDEAIEIIAGGSVSGAGEKHLGLMQRGSALAQLRSSSDSQRFPSQDRVASFLAMQGEKFGSTVLSALAVHAEADPFKKVTKMIKDMIIKLQEEATEEAEHKGFCDTELGTNKQTRDAKTSDAEELTASIEQMSAEAEKMATEAADLSAQILATDKAVAEATATRNEEKAKNTATIKDAKEAKAAVEKALGVLKTFYEKAANPAAASALQEGPIEYDPRAIAMMKPSFIQGPMDDAPSAVSKPYTGGESGGVLGMLEVIISDFERLETETSEEEHTSDEEYDAFMADSAEDKAVKEADVKHKTNRKQRLESDVATAKRDLKSTQEELDAALAYYEKLKPSCVDAGESYEERVARREEEIQSLKEALKILSE